MTMVFSISHVAYLPVLPKTGNPGAGGAGLLLFLVFLTQSNDVSQFLWGKSFEAISKRPLELNIRVGPKRPILEILNVCLRLAASPRLDLEPD